VGRAQTRYTASCVVNRHHQAFACNRYTCRRRRSPASPTLQLFKLFCLHASRQLNVAFMQMQARPMYSNLLTSDRMLCRFHLHSHAHSGPQLVHPLGSGYFSRNALSPSTYAAITIRPEVIANWTPPGLEPFPFATPIGCAGWACRSDWNGTRIEHPELCERHLSHHIMPFKTATISGNRPVISAVASCWSAVLIRSTAPQSLWAN
jgi:hypothetical protein